jgi:hypothetical protein
MKRFPWNIGNHLGNYQGKIASGLVHWRFHEQLWIDRVALHEWPTNFG